MVDGLYVTLKLRSSLNDTAERLRAGKEAFQNERFSEASEDLRGAEGAASAAVAATRHPSFVIASYLPWIKADIQAARALTTTAELTSRAGAEALVAVDSMSVSEEGLAASLLREGKVDFDTLAEGAPHIREVSELLATAVSELEEVPDPTSGALADVVDEVQAEVELALETSEKGVTLLENLPELLGETEPQTYLLAFQALGETRGTGGLIGLYGVLRTHRGEIDLVEVGPTKAVLPEEIKDPAEAPSWFVENYGPQSSLVQFRQANLTPNFAVAARVLKDMYEKETGESLDGVIALDPVAVGYMTAGTGALRAPGIPDKVGPDNADEILLKRSYEEFDSDTAQSRYLSRLVEDFWQRIEDGELDERAFAEGLAEAALTQHVKVYSSDPGLQDALNDLEVAGTFARHGPNIQMLFHNNYGRNKVDFFLYRTMETVIQLTSEGEARISTDVLLENSAPSEGSSILLGQGKDKGINRMQLSFLLPENSEVRNLTVDGEDRPARRFDDTGFPVVYSFLDIPPGEQLRVSLEYEAPANYFEDTYRLTLVPQTLTRPDNYSLLVKPPVGFRFQSVNGTGGSRESFEARGGLKRTLTYDFKLGKAD